MTTFHELEEGLQPGRPVKDGAVFPRPRRRVLIGQDWFEVGRRWLRGYVLNPTIYTNDAA